MASNIVSHIAFDFQPLIFENWFDIEEVWRDIPDWPGYQVSERGRVKSTRRLAVKGTSKNASAYEPKILKPGSNKFGHKFVILCDGKTKKTKSVHALVLEAFVGPCPIGDETYECCHNDGNESNNNLYNLRWDTVSQNQIDVMRHGGAKGHSVKEYQVREIWKLLVDGKSNASIARQFKVLPELISCIRNGISWSYLTSTLEGWPLPSVALYRNKDPIYPDEKFHTKNGEIWEKFPLNHAYRVSNFGRIQTCYRQIKKQKIGPRWAITDEWKDRILSPNRKGYLLLSITINGKNKSFTIHHAVMMAFVGEKPKGYIVCHKDDDPSNNKIENLRYDTLKANAIERYENAKKRQLGDQDERPHSESIH